MRIPINVKNRGIYGENGVYTMTSAVSDDNSMTNDC